MRELFTADPDNLLLVHHQLGRLERHNPKFAVMGSIGRLAIRLDLGDPTCEPLPVQPEYNRWRDIDLVRMPPIDGHSMASIGGPLPADYKLDENFTWHEGKPAMVHQVWDNGKREYVSHYTTFDPRVFELKKRIVLVGGKSTTVYTLSAGTQYQFERGAKREGKYAASLAAFDAFIKKARRTHPKEFLPDKYYEPFDRMYLAPR